MDELRALRSVIKTRFDQSDAVLKSGTEDCDHLLIAGAARNAFRAVLANIDRAISLRPAPIDLGRMIRDAAKARETAR